MTEPCFECPYCTEDERKYPVCSKANKALTNGEYLIQKPANCPIKK